ncbi:MAG: hypothetical protein L6R40_007854 [Gallowayella cf. fulva]|nr:MAG: hypothetical protein L6R40_007854 [Xanthomendoza cf. fulva]
MGPRDSRDSTETNGNVHPSGKGKGKAKISRTSSNASLGDLTTEAVDTGIAAVRQIAKILRFAQGYHEEIGDVEGIYGLGIRQQARIDELETTVTNLAFRKDQEMAKLQDKNDAYQANVRQFTLDREELERQRASIDDTRKAMQSKIERQKEIEINRAKQEFSDQSNTRVKQLREELEKKIQALETEKDGFKDTTKKLEEKNIQAKKDLKKQKESFELDKRSSQSYIMRLESELKQINAASTVSPQTPEFYIDGFRQLWEGIQDVAVNNFSFLPEDTKPLDSDTVRDRLSSASAIFKYPPLSTESAVATFLRACAIQNFLSTKTISIVRRRYFAEPTAAVERKSGTQPMDSILDTISNIPAATSSQELSWRLTTVDRLDRLGSHDPSAPTEISTEPRQEDVIDEILGTLHYFQSPSDQLLRAKLTEITSMAIKLWSALRKDSCRVDFNYDPSTGDWQQWAFVDAVTTNGSMAANSPSEIPVAQLPSKSFMLFPRITGFFESDRASPRILHAGLALPDDSPAFRKGLQEIKHIEYATKEFKRSLRRGSSAQSSPVTGKRQGDWHAPHRDFH